MPDFKTWDAGKARAKIPTDKRSDIVKKFFDGDHWQEGLQYIGPLPQDAPADQLAWFMHEVARGFVSKNAIREVIERRTGGVVGKEPAWSWAPRNADASWKLDALSVEQQDAIAKLNSWCTTWWNERDVHGIFEELVLAALYYEWSTLRLFIPEGVLETRANATTGATERFVTGATVEQALTKIWLERPDVKMAFVYTDPSTKEQIGITVYKLSEDEGGEERVEVVFLDGESTVIKVFSGAGSDQATHTLGKRLTMFTVRHPRFITEQVIQLQNAINLGLTMLPRGLGVAGFVERIFLAAKAPGDWEYDDKGRPIPGTFKVRPYPVGPNSTAFVQGQEYEERDPQGNVTTKVATPNVVFREPSSMQPVIDGKDTLYSDLLDEVDQAHFLMAGEVLPSGRSRQDSRAEFLRTLRRTAKAVNAVGRWLIETAVAWAEDISGTPGQWTKDYRVDFNCRLDAGPLSADEINADISAGDKGYLPKEVVMQRLGIDDTDAALAQIMEQPGAQLDIAKRQGDAAAAWTTAGAPFEVAAWLAGIRPDDLEGMKDDVTKMEEALNAGAAAADTGGEPLAPPPDIAPPAPPAPVPARR